MSPQRRQSICILILVGVPTTVGLAVVLQLLLRYPDDYMPLLLGYILSLVLGFAMNLIPAFNKGRKNQFTLRSVLLLVGFGSCVFVVLQYGKPWQKIYVYPSQFRHIASSPDGQLVAGYSKNVGDPIHIFRVRYGHRLGSIDWTGDPSKVDFKFTSDGSHLLILGEDSGAAVVRLFDLNDCQEMRSWTGAFPAQLAEEVDHFFLSTENAETMESTISLFEITSPDPIAGVAQPEALPSSAKDTLSAAGGQLLVHELLGVGTYWETDDWYLVKSDGSVWNRRTDERWYGLLMLPAFWGADFFLLCLIFPPARESLAAISNIPQVDGEES